MYRLLVLLLALLALGPDPAVRCEPLGLCTASYCSCLPAQHPNWLNMNCTVPPDQMVYIRDGDIPAATTNVIITGARYVEFQSNSLSGIWDLRKIFLKGCSVVVIKRSAAVELNLLRGLLDIENCKLLRIEPNAFVNIKGPLSVNISGCARATLEGPAFSWLLEMNISNVGQLNLAPEVFMRDLVANSGTKHGPDMKIELKNVTIPNIPGQTFGHSAAKITMEAVDVNDISSEAFSGNTISNLTAADCVFRHISAEAFSAKTQIGFLNINRCKVHNLASKALLSAVTNLNISYSRFNNIETGAINSTVVSVAMMFNKFHMFMVKGFELSSLNRLQMENNSFDLLPGHAIVVPGASIHDLIFINNEIEGIKPGSLGFIGQSTTYSNIVYKSNYYGQRCHCNVTQNLNGALDVDSVDFYDNESFCTVDEFQARCFDVPDQNMLLRKFMKQMCAVDHIQCKQFEANTEIKNPRFPHNMSSEDFGPTEKNTKTIGIVVVTVLGCIIIALIFSLYKWMKRKGHCVTIKNTMTSSHSTCGSFCDRICVCGSNNGLENTSVSQMSVHEYSERLRLNEPGAEQINATLLAGAFEEPTSTEDKTTQTLPEELTKELLENLKNKLEDPENYVEAREMIEHLYELIKVEESCNTNSSRTPRNEENIYELPFQNTQPRIGKNKKKMISVGTRTPSLDRLLPFSPYNRQTALAHEYFEPKDFAVHLYAEIANNDHKKTLLGAMPDVVIDQSAPRGPYLRAVREKTSIGSPSLIIKPYISSPKIVPTVNYIVSPCHMSLKSNKSNASNTSGRMMNRPLPQAPADNANDPGEGPSNQQVG